MQELGKHEVTNLESQTSHVQRPEIVQMGQLRKRVKVTYSIDTQVDLR